MTTGAITATRRVLITLTTMLPLAFIGTGAAHADPDAEVTFCQDMASQGYLGDCIGLVSYGRAVCIQFDNGRDWYSILTQLDDAVIDEGKSASILVTAVADLCPWHESKTP